MNSIILISLLSIFSPILSAPDARDLDHYIDRRELVTVDLPVPLALTSSDIDDEENQVEDKVQSNDFENISEDINEIVDLKTPLKQKIKEIQQIEIATSTESVISTTLLSTLKSTSTSTSSSPRQKESTKVPSLEYYYKFIDRNIVDETNRGGNVYITYSCCSEVRR